MFFLLFLLDDRRIQIRISDWWDPDPGGPKTYESYGSGSATLLADWRLFLKSTVKKWLGWPERRRHDRPEGEDEGDEGEGALTPRQRLQASVHLHAAARVSLLIRKESIPVIRVPAPLFRKRCGSFPEALWIWIITERNPDWIQKCSKLLQKRV